LKFVLPGSTIKWHSEWNKIMTNDVNHKRLSPYISYRTFLNFIDGMQQQVPSRIDRSYWNNTLSGSTGTQLMAALRFLKLIDMNGKPSNQLKALSSAKGEQRTAIIKEIAVSSFAFIFQGSLEPQNATYAQLEELFHDTFQCTNDVARKCIKFFIAMSTDAKVPLSPFITKRSKSSHAVIGTTKQRKRNSTTAIRNLVVPQDGAVMEPHNHWKEMLINKFPTFDPGWPDEIKLKWFTAFDELIKRNPS
jgi:hypothetical protein